MARKAKVTYQEIMDRIRFNADRGKPYTTYRTGNSIYVTFRGVTYYATTLSTKEQADTMPSQQLYFIAKVKRHIEKKRLYSKIKPNYTNPDDIKYFDYNHRVRPGDLFDTNVYSVDISKAYWWSAYMDGFINEQLFSEGMLMDKRVRLASLGSFAKQISVYEFDGKEERLKNTIQPKHPHIFFNQANTIYHLMDNCKRRLGSDFLFYWTDGLYMKGGLAAAKLCERILLRNQFESETTRLISIERRSKSFISTEMVNWKITEKEYAIGKPTNIRR